MERVRLAGLESALDPGTRDHLTRLGVGPGTHCLEVGAGGGSVAFWLAERVAPGGLVVATDLETDFLESAAPGYPTLKVLTHDITAEDPPTGFDFVHARWLVEWLPDKRLALGRMVSALRPGGTLLIEEPDFVTIYGCGAPPRVDVPDRLRIRPARDGRSGCRRPGGCASRGALPGRAGRNSARHRLPSADRREAARAGPCRRRGEPCGIRASPCGSAGSERHGRSAHDSGRLGHAAVMT